MLICRACCHVGPLLKLKKRQYVKYYFSLLRCYYKSKHFDLSIYRSIYLSIYLTIYLSTYLIYFKSLEICIKNIPSISYFIYYILFFHSFLLPIFFFPLPFLIPSTNPNYLAPGLCAGIGLVQSGLLQAETKILRRERRWDFRQTSHLLLPLRRRSQQ